mmetsp:Transcript_2113/g.3174  ORF Transcript_2113/g.3174 Transcript_2113/m.3174 type:complete len:223 (-) Transcript_2113:751-1419(-)
MCGRIPHLGSARYIAVFEVPVALLLLGLGHLHLLPIVHLPALLRIFEIQKLHLVRQRPGVAAGDDDFGGLGSGKSTGAVRVFRIRNGDQCARGFPHLQDRQFHPFRDLILPHRESQRVVLVKHRLSICEATRETNRHSAAIIRGSELVLRRREGLLNHQTVLSHVLEAVDLEERCLDPNRRAARDAVRLVSFISESKHGIQSDIGRLTDFHRHACLDQSFSK